MFARAIICLFLLHYCVSKENAVYQVPGVEIVDLIRGFHPKGRIQLTKVEGDRSSLPDGVYFIPEDDALSPPEYLEFNGQRKNPGLDKKQDGVTTSN